MSSNVIQYHSGIPLVPNGRSQLVRRDGWRARRALSGEAAKISVDETDWRCRGCFKANECTNPDVDVPARCQTCARACPTVDGWWHCDKRDETCPTEA